MSGETSTIRKNLFRVEGPFILNGYPISATPCIFNTTWPTSNSLFPRIIVDSFRDVSSMKCKTERRERREKKKERRKEETVSVSAKLLGKSHKS